MLTIEDFFVEKKFDIRMIGTFEKVFTYVYHWYVYNFYT